MLMHAVRDGVVTGALERTKQTCRICGEGTCTIYIASLSLPQGVNEGDNRIIFNQARSNPKMPYIGVGCGCYAKAHRQLAHIHTRREKS